MSKSCFFIWSDEATSFLTVIAETAEEASEQAKTTVSKLMFQHNLKDQKPTWFEVSTATVQGTATKTFPDANDLQVLEIK